MGSRNAVLFFIISLVSISSLFPAIFPVNNVGNAGAGTLRAAIDAANARVGMDTIEFTFTVGGVKPITLTANLPYIQDSLFIDGSSDPFYTGVPLIEINGNSLAANGLNILSSAPYTHIRGLIINNALANGLYIEADHVKVTGCYIGTDFTGLMATPNRFAGVEAQNVKYLQIGGTGLNDGNLISGNDFYGIRLFFSDSTEIIGNKIGTDTNGTAAVANGTALVAFDGAGISSVFSNAMIVGGNTLAHRNIISGNLAGINHIGSHAEIYGNHIGTDLYGTGTVANLTVGVIIEGDSNSIGGILANQGNLISGNSYNAISISSANSFHNLIQGNLIGTDNSGAGTLPNGNSGISILGGAKLNTIGGLTPAHRNVISGNFGAGIDLGAATDSNYIYNNYIGTDINGTAALGNGSNGINIDNGKHVFIGNATAAGANIISSNGANGIRISGTDGDSAFIKHNYIGTDVSGLANLANTGRGIFLLGDASSNEIGGILAGEGNTIANNLQGGVEVNGIATIDNRILGNSIYDHPVVGIKLSAGNNNQEAPVLSGFAAGTGTSTIFGTFNSAPSTTYRLEFFTSNTAGQGKTFIGTTTIMTDATGAYNLNEVVPATITAAQPVITSTATDPDGNTSPFGVETVLGATLYSFTVEALPLQTALLSWEIEDQQQNIYYEIEHQAPGEEFLKVGEQTAYLSYSQSRAYQFEVTNLVTGTHQFRVVQVSPGGLRSYSKIIELDLSQATPYQVLVPNPLSRGSSLQIRVDQTQNLDIYLVDMKGKRHSKLFSGESKGGSFQSISLQKLNGISRGIYVLSIEGRDFRINKKVIIE